MGWYEDTRRNRLDVDSSKIATNSGLAAKAIGDAFLGVVGVVEDRKKLDILEADAKARNEKNQYDLSKAYAEDTQNAIDKTYLGYVDTNTGKFNKEQFDKDNVGLPMNQVSMDARLKQKQLENAYSVDLEKIDKKAQEEISNEVVKEMFKHSSKEEFNKNVNPDLIRYANGTTMVAVDKFYNDATVQEAKLANAAAKLENAANINDLKMDLKKQELELEKEKLNNKKNAPKEVSAADSNAIFKSTVSLYGGLIDPETDQMTNVDATQVKNIMEVSAMAAELLRTKQAGSHPEAVQLAYNKKKKETEEPIPTFDPKDPYGWLKK